MEDKAKAVKLKKRLLDENEKKDFSYKKIRTREEDKIALIEDHIAAIERVLSCRGRKKPDPDDLEEKFAGLVILDNDQLHAKEKQLREEKLLLMRRQSGMHPLPLCDYCLCNLTYFYCIIRLIFSYKPKVSDLLLSDEETRLTGEARPNRGFSIEKVAIRTCRKYIHRISCQWYTH
jgi:hypothetical protein